MTCVPSVWRRRATSKPRAPSNAYDANADESRYLLGRDHRATHEAAFLAKSESLYGMKGVDLPSYEPRLADTWKAYRADHEDKRFTGELRRELDNITFPGERAAMRQGYAQRAPALGRRLPARRRRPGRPGSAPAPCRVPLTALLR